MEIWNIILLLVNIILVLLLSNKVRKIIDLTNEQRAIKEDMVRVVNEHSQIAELIIDQLESRLTEVREVIGNQNEPIIREKVKEKDQVKEIETVKSPFKNGRESMQFNEESYYNLMGTSNSKINYMKQMGMSNQEIAQRLNLSQGEIDLKLNLQEKQNPTQLKKRKTK